MERKEPFAVRCMLHVVIDDNPLERGVVPFNSPEELYSTLDILYLYCHVIALFLSSREVAPEDRVCQFPEVCHAVQVAQPEKLPEMPPGGAHVAGWVPLYIVLYTPSCYPITIIQQGRILLNLCVHRYGCTTCW